MGKIFCSPALKPLLSLLTIRSKQQIVAQWKLKNQELVTMQKYTVHFGRSCTKAMSKRLSQLELSYDTMKSAFEDNVDDRQAFYDYLKGAGINRKAWYEIIWDHFCGRKRLA